MGMVPIKLSGLNQRRGFDFEAGILGKTGHLHLCWFRVVIGEDPSLGWLISGRSTNISKRSFGPIRHRRISLGVGRSFRVLEISMNACGAKLVVALIWNQNSNFEMFSTALDEACL